MRVLIMKKNAGIIVLACCLGLLLSGIIGCKKQDTLSDEGLEQFPLNPLVLPGADEGLVTFLSGEVERYSGESWIPLEIGD